MEKYCNSLFTNCEVFDRFISCCCPDFLPEGCISFDPENPDTNLLSIWNSSRLLSLRKLTQRGDYRFCKSFCPVKLNTDLVKVPESWNVVGTPKHVKFSFDSTCNLQCVSCRDTKLFSNQERTKKILFLVERDLLPTVEDLELEGTGDFLASPVFRRWVRNFDSSKYINLKRILLHTNLQLMTPSFWNGNREFLSYVKHFTISIDAATEETYKQVRIGGSWKQLWTNLKCVLESEFTEGVQFCFTVHSVNCKEVVPFFNLIVSLAEKFPKKHFYIYYSELQKWASVSTERFNQLKLAESEKNSVIHNLEYLYSIKKPINLSLTTNLVKISSKTLL